MRKKLRNTLAITAYFVLLLLLMPFSYNGISAWLFLFPVLCLSIFLFLYITLQNRREGIAILNLSGIVIFAAMIHYFIRITHFCAWQTFDTQYVNRNNPSDTIVLKGFSCFLTDTDAQLFEEIKISEHLTWTIPYYSKSPDKNQWALAR